MDQTIASQTAQIPQFRGTSRAQMDFAAMEARQRAAAPAQADQDFSFADFIDMINPLQHIPVVSSIYREMTGDTISPAMKVAGGGLFGGPLGAIGSLVGAIYEQASGEEFEQTVAGWFGDDKSNPAPADEIKLADIQWNQTDPVVGNFGLAAATPLPETKPAEVKADTAVAAAEAPKPSAMFDKLQKGIAPASYTPPPQVPSYFNPNVAQYHGVQPAAVKTPVKDVVPANDSVQQPQSDFAKKMMDALDRYEASKVAR